jgi:hypothetical protein
MKNHIHAYEVSQLDIPHLDSRILEYLRHGLIKASAKAAIVYNNYSEKMDVFKNWEVTPEIWGRASGYDCLTLELDKFFVAYQNELYTSVELIGLSFNRSDFLKAFNIKNVGELHLRPKSLDVISKGGRPPSVNWPDFVAAVSIWLTRRNDEAEGIAALGPDIIMNDISEVGAEWGLDFPRATYQLAIRKLRERMTEESKK